MKAPLLAAASDALNRFRAVAGARVILWRLMSSASYVLCTPCFVCMHKYVCVRVCVCLFVCVWLCVYVCMCLCVYVRVLRQVKILLEFLRPLGYVVLRASRHGVYPRMIVFESVVSLLAVLG